MIKLWYFFHKHGSAYEQIPTPGAGILACLKSSAGPQPDTFPGLAAFYRAHGPRDRKPRGKGRERRSIISKAQYPAHTPPRCFPQGVGRTAGKVRAQNPKARAARASPNTGAQRTAIIITHQQQTRRHPKRIRMAAGLFRAGPHVASSGTTALRPIKTQGAQVLSSAFFILRMLLI
jgi:hypothetical protein